MRSCRWPAWPRRSRSPAASQTPSPPASARRRRSSRRLIEDLPLNRGIEATTALTPGVLRTGPSTSGVPELSISGGISSENLVLVNGVVAQDNVRRSALPVYIEDSLQETTITTSGVSAEFGRFSGGVDQRDHQVGREPLQRHLPRRTWPTTTGAR